MSMTSATVQSSSTTDAFIYMKTSHLYFIYSRRFYIFAGHKYIQKYKMTVFCAFEAEKSVQKHRSARFCAFKAEKAGQKHKTARFCAFEAEKHGQKHRSARFCAFKIDKVKTIDIWQERSRTLSWKTL